MPAGSATQTWRIILGLGYVVKIHGDRFRPLRIGLWDPFQMTNINWLIIGGDPNHFHKSWDHPPSIGVCYFFLFGRVSIYEPSIVVVIQPFSTESNNFSPKKPVMSGVMGLL